MENNELKIERILIREPYSKGKPLVCEITVKGRYGNLELQIDDDMMRPIVDHVAAAIAEAGRRTAEAFAAMAETYINPQGVIEHAPQPVDQLTTEDREELANIAEDTIDEAPLPPAAPAPEGGD